MSKALALAALIAAGGCATLEDLRFSATPPDPASRVAPAAHAYPSVQAGCHCEAPSQPTGHFQRLLIIVLENQDYAHAMADPYLRELARQGANFTSFHGLFHPSYSNYLAMVAGKEIRTLFDRQKDLDECTIGDLLKSKGLGWKNYAEGYPGSAERCFTGSRTGKYELKLLIVAEDENANPAGFTLAAFFIRREFQARFGTIAEVLELGAHDARILIEFALR